VFQVREDGRPRLPSRVVQTGRRSSRRLPNMEVPS
jgi:hypothetical protein